MKIAYLMLAHKNPNQIKRFLMNIKNGDIYIHIDKKKDIYEFDVVKNKNVFFIENRVAINWGGYTMMEATFNLLNVAIKKEYDYYILVSGDDYFIKSEDDFIKFLYENKGKSFIEYNKFETDWKNLKYRYNNYNLFENKNSLLKKIIQKIVNSLITKRNMYNNWIAYKGSQWWCLDLYATKYLLNYVNKNNSIKRYFRHTIVPDEMMIQTILLNSPYSKKIVNDNLRYIRLGNKNHPDILTKNNFDELIKAKNKFLARKFDEKYDIQILDMIDNYLKQ